MEHKVLVMEHNVVATEHNTFVMLVGGSGDKATPCSGNTSEEEPRVLGFRAWLWLVDGANLCPPCRSVFKTWD